MSYKYYWGQPKLLHPHQRVVYKALPGRVRRISLATPMTALLRGHDTIGRRQP
jgi:hypothetical protein